MMSNNDTFKRLAKHGPLRGYYMNERRALLMRLGAIEDLLGIPRSVAPRGERRKMTVDQRGDYVTDTDTD